MARVDGGLRDPVHVDQHRGVVAGVGAVQAVPLFEPPDVERLTAEDDVAQSQLPTEPRIVPVRLQQLLERGRRLVQHGDALLHQEPEEAVRGAARGRGDQDEPAAVEEGSPQLPDGEVEGEGVGHGPYVVRTEVEQFPGRREQAEHVPVRDDHALGAPRGTRGVDDVGGVVAGEGAGAFVGAQIVLGERGQVRTGVRAVDLHGGQVRDAKPWRPAVRAQQQGGLRVREQGLDPVRRVLRVDGKVGGARLEDRQERHHEIDGRRQAERDQTLRPAAVPHEQPRQSVGPRVQLSVRQGRGPARHGDRGRCPARLRLEGVHEGAEPVVRALPRAHLQERAPLRVAEHVDLTERTVGPRDDPAQERLEPCPVIAEVRGAVEARVGVDGEGQTPGRRVHAQHEVLDRARREIAVLRGARAERRLRVERQGIRRGAEDAGASP